MSSFYKKTKHPVTGSIENALWVDDHFGRHKYGVEFPDGSVFPDWEIEPKQETSVRDILQEIVDSYDANLCH